ncbi:hypothetical protein F2Q70_00030473 [Brassica cretica]|uniref:Uncharacterized protein n=2 Tax=Brassica cretica TaxID=69181 RepID=A0A8S9FQ46_BRACR|nr:hypothetical protein F2Q70_00030473 [Brassica cretica]KAF2552396.1 hypothetical protein F2Q68_00034918 [Brassica cretica]KAF3595915.1 hypothetical protein DY000_02023057 [Brassica cretica]
MERDDEDVYFDDESAEVVISSLRLGDDQESSLFTNSNWFAFDDEKTANEGSMASPRPNADDDDVVIGEADEDFKDTVDSSPPVGMETEDSTTTKNPSENPSEPEAEKSAAWVEWRETSESTGPSSNPDEATTLPNGEVKIDKEGDGDDTDKKSAEDSATGACSDETAEKSPDAASGDEIAEKLKDSGPDASEVAAAESHENAQSSEPAITQETKKSQEADVAAETEEAVKEEEKVV